MSSNTINVSLLGLEIASDQQTILDAVMQGRASVNEIALWPPLDHPLYRRMIETFAELKQRGQCIKLVAIDSGVDNNIDRDLWMALSLAEQAERYACSGVVGCAAYVEAR